MASQDSAESKVLQRHVHKLAKSLDPVVLSTILYAAEIIDDRIWEDSRLEIKAPNYDRCLKLLGAVIRCTKAKPSTFQVFCEALEQQEVTKDLAAQLRDNLQDIRSETTSSTNEYSEVSVGTKRKTYSDQQEEVNTGNQCEKKAKLTPTLKQGKIKDDKILMDIAWEIGERWEEVGIALGIDYTVLNSTIGSDAKSPSHLKSFHMLQEWKKRAADSLTYITLASALEGAGLKSCAQKYCYTSCSIENEQ